MVKLVRPERSRPARSSRQFSRFYRSINWDRVFGTQAALVRTFWTPEEDNRLRMLLEACKPIDIVAAELKRSAKAVKGRAYILRISLKRVNLMPKAKWK